MGQAKYKIRPRASAVDHATFYGNSIFQRREFDERREYSVSMQQNAGCWNRIVELLRNPFQPCRGNPWQLYGTAADN